MRSAKTPQPISSRQKIVFGIGIVSLVLVVAFVSILQLGARNNTPTAATTADDTVSKQEVENNLSVVDKSIKQATSDQAAVKSALKDSDKRIKVVE